MTPPRERSSADDRRLADALLVVAKRHPVFALVAALLLANGASIANLAKSAIGVSAVEERVARVEELLVGDAESPGVIVKLADLKAGQDDLRKSVSSVAGQLRAVQRTLSPKGMSSHEIPLEDPLSLDRVRLPLGAVGL